MRRSLAAVLVIASLVLVSCANPTEDPLPGTSTTPERTRTTSSPPNGGEDETEAVCDEAQETSNDAVEELNGHVADVRAAISAGNTGAATSAGLAARTTATGWRDDLAGLAERPIDDEVRGVLDDGVAMIDELIETDPREMDPTEVQSRVDGFLDDLERVCG
jgi:hypothetical protein